MKRIITLEIDTERFRDYMVKDPIQNTMAFTASLGNLILAHEDDKNNAARLSDLVLLMFGTEVTQNEIKP